MSYKHSVFAHTVVTAKRMKLISKSFKLFSKVLDFIVVYYRFCQTNEIVDCMGEI